MPAGKPYQTTDLPHKTGPARRASRLTGTGLLTAITLAGPLLGPNLPPHKTRQSRKPVPASIFPLVLFPAP